MSILNVDNIGFQYTDQWILRDVSFDARQGELIGIIGPNGSGKTTLLKVLGGILAPREGCVRIQGEPVHEMPRRRLAKIISGVSQNTPAVFPFTAQEVVLMGRSPHLGKWRFEGEADFRIVRQAMALTETLSFRTRSMNELSGGERQRVLIARALAQEPKIMLFDEPLTFMDIRHQIALLDLLKNLTCGQALTVIVVIHDINMAALYCDRVVLLHAGRVHAMGPPGDVITESGIAEVFRTNVSVNRHPVTGSPQVTLLGAIII
jgi:iron complex transport system ATP-binding protein